MTGLMGADGYVYAGYDAERFGSEKKEPSEEEKNAEQLRDKKGEIAYKAFLKASDMDEQTSPNWGKLLDTHKEKYREVASAAIESLTRREKGTDDATLFNTLVAYYRKQQIA